ncbi:MAG TPA: hypothetical protein ENK41_02155 [Rhodobacteraceae bacterium]|nr:hypothetical protein [Paracoccaceae bacterium]
MTIKEITSHAIADARAILAGKLNKDEMAEIERIIQSSILNAAISMSESCRRMTVRHAGPEADIAHKIHEELENKREALLANLNSFR